MESALIIARAGEYGLIYGISGLLIEESYNIIGEVKMNKYIAIPLFFCLILIILNPLLSAKERRGADVLVRKIDGDEVRGELIAVKADALLILDEKTGIDVTSKVNEIDKIIIIKKPHYWRGLGIGLLAGFTAGSFYRVVFPGTAEPAGVQFKGGVLICIPGALAGLFISELFAIDKTYQIQGWPSSIVKSRLEKLRKKARVKDFN